MEANGWSDLSADILTIIFEMLENLKDIISFSAVCKSWKVVASTSMEEEESWFPTRCPWLLLAEDTGLDASAAHVGWLEAYYDKAFYEALILYEAGEHVDVDDYEYSKYTNYLTDERNREFDRIITNIGDLFLNISQVRGLFSLKTGKVYNLDLPEATNRTVLGTNKGWLVTLAKDLEINLLHPFLRHQIPLPPMHTLPASRSQYHMFISRGIIQPLEHKFDDDDYCHSFIHRIVMSSRVPIKSAFQDMDTSDLPVVMVIYGESAALGFARVGDKSWIKMIDPIRAYDDIVYHKEQFYVMDSDGDIYLCDIANKEVRDTVTVPGPIKTPEVDQGYLIESLSGSHIWLVVRIIGAGEYYRSHIEPMFDGMSAGKFRYRTTAFRVYKFEVQCCDSGVEILSDWNEVKDLGNEAIFVGKSSSVSIAASEFIKPNSIYFTDDSPRFYRESGKSGSGHDMGIYNMKTGTIEPHFQGVSIHRFSPSIWYI